MQYIGECRAHLEDQGKTQRRVRWDGVGGLSSKHSASLSLSVFLSIGRDWRDCACAEWSWK